MGRASLVALVVASALVGSAPARAAAPSDGIRGAAPDAVDTDGNDVVDTLDRKLAYSEPSDPVEVIVMLDREPTSARLDDQRDHVGAFQVEQRYSDLDAYLATVTARQVGDLAARADVRAVHENGIVRATLDTATRESGVTEARSDFGVHGSVDGSSGYSAADVVIAIGDTGINADHPDLDNGKVLVFADFINGGCDSTPLIRTPFDDHGHGTHVSSIAAGEGQGNPRAVGVAPGAALVGLKVLSSAGSGSEACVAAGIQWATDNKAAFGIDVINLSLGTDGPSDGTDLISLRVNQAAAAGITVVVSAGNSGPGTGTVGSPGAAAGAITVGNLADPKDTDGANAAGFRLARTSSRGPTQDGRTKPDISAPGVDIFAAFPVALDPNTDGYAVQTGTSMASPFVAGVAALILHANAALTPSQLKLTLMNTAVDWGETGVDNEYGAGRLDAHAAIDSVLGAACTGPQVPTHIFGSGSLANGAEVDNIPVAVPDTGWPIGLTLLMSGNGTSPNVNAELRDPAGTLVASSAFNNPVGRQEFFAHSPTTTGNYELRVSSSSGGGTYTYDLSLPPSTGGGADGCPAQAAFSPPTAPAPAPVPATTPTTQAPAPAPAPPAPAPPAPAPAPDGLGDGYVLLDNTGGLFSFGTAPFLGSVPGIKQANPSLVVGRIMGAFSTHGGAGYVAFDEDGRVFSFGAAQNLGSVADRVAARLMPRTRIVAAFPANDGAGYVMVGEDGSVHAFGAAPYFGSVTELRAVGLAGPASIVGGFSVDNGNGYVLIDDGGGLFTFGSARFFGSVPALRNAGVPVGPARVLTGFSIDNGAGYVMIDELGGLFTFGSARFFGSVPALRNAGVPVGPAKVMGGFSVDNGNGYVMVDEFGGLFSFGSARFFGSIPALRAAGVAIGQATIVGGFAV